MNPKNIKKISEKGRADIGRAFSPVAIADIDRSGIGGSFAVFQKSGNLSPEKHILRLRFQYFGNISCCHYRINSNMMA